MRYQIDVAIIGEGTLWSGLIRERMRERKQELEGEGEGERFRVQRREGMAPDLALLLSRARATIATMKILTTAPCVDSCGGWRRSCTAIRYVKVVQDVGSDSDT